MSVDVIEKFVKKLSSSPGVYQMHDEKGNVLYVGKARNLKKRVINYTLPEKTSLRIQRMIFQTAHMECTTTATETEALLLEARLIKKLKPKYNILLRDDKSFPYIVITKSHDFPMIAKHRGAKNKGEEYFGPFASSTAANEVIDILHKIFMLRNCSDNVFKSRTRPCMQYQIKRCTAPCVAKVSKNQYAEQVEMARQFLLGNDRKIQKRLAEKMLEASNNMNFEEAAILRDRINSLTKVQSYRKSDFTGDVLAIYQAGGVSCIQIFFFTNGQNFGNRPYYPKHDKEELAEDILSSFISQFYSDKPVPKEIITNIKISDEKIVASSFKTKISTPTKGIKKEIIDNAFKNAKEALKRKLSSEADNKEIFEEIAKQFKLSKTPERIEVYDNSHISGKHALGAMIAVGKEGFIKSGYRKFNMGDDKKGDDYAMMYEMIYRRLNKVTDENKPDLLLIDGGLGQLNSALKAMKDSGVEIPIAAIAKGVDRNAGREKFFLPNIKGALEFHDNVTLLYFLQRIRDEAHRFVITSHRGKRSKAITENPLDNIYGIGQKRKKTLLMHFGSAKAIADATLNDLQKVDGINKDTAKKIYDFFHEGL